MIDTNPRLVKGAPLSGGDRSRWVWRTTDSAMWHRFSRFWGSFRHRFAESRRRMIADYRERMHTMA
jgi:hypothetical protein